MQILQGAAPFGGANGLTQGVLDVNNSGLHFGGNNGLMSQSTEDIFTLTLTNAHASLPLTARLFAPASLAAGKVVDGTFNDISGTAGLSAVGQPRTMAWLNEYISYNPSLITKIYATVSSGGSANFNMTWNVYTWSPFKANADSYQLRPSTMTNEYRNQSNEITIKTEIYTGNQSYIEIPVAFGTSITLHLSFLASLNNQLKFVRDIADLKTQYVIASRQG